MNLELKREAPYALLYCLLYIASLWLTKETELVHWATMVLGPLLVLHLVQRRRGLSWKETLVTVGLRRDNLRRGILLGIAVGVSMGLLQALAGPDRHKIFELGQSGKILYVLPLALLLMLLTAGFTEEFLFRGLLQTRLQAWSGSGVAAVLATSALFGLYHWSYAYYQPEWGAHGDLTTALAISFPETAIGAVIFGFIYMGSKNNLLAPVAAHAISNAVPAMAMLHTMLHIGSG